MRRINAIFIVPDVEHIGDIESISSPLSGQQAALWTGTPGPKKTETMPISTTTAPTGTN